jgi:hypothetical protein
MSGLNTARLVVVVHLNQNSFFILLLCVLVFSRPLVPLTLLLLPQLASAIAGVNQYKSMSSTFSLFMPYPGWNCAEKGMAPEDGKMSYDAALKKAMVRFACRRWRCGLFPVSGAGNGAGRLGTLRQPG